MKIRELIERDFTITPDGLVLDNSGNEYRNEEGKVEYLETKNRKTIEKHINRSLFTKTKGEWTEV